MQCYFLLPSMILIIIIGLLHNLLEEFDFRINPEVIFLQEMTNKIMPQLKELMGVCLDIQNPLTNFSYI